MVRRFVQARFRLLYHACVILPVQSSLESLMDPLQDDKWCLVEGQGVDDSSLSLWLYTVRSAGKISLFYRAGKDPVTHIVTLLAKTRSIQSK
jgi:hypothetical protein